MRIDEEPASLEDAKDQLRKINHDYRCLCTTLTALLVRGNKDTIGFVVLDESDEAEAHLQEVKELETNLRNGTLDPWCRDFHLDARIMPDDIFPNLGHLFWDEKWDEVRQVVSEINTKIKWMVGIHWEESNKHHSHGFRTVIIRDVDGYCPCQSRHLGMALGSELSVPLSDHVWEVIKTLKFILPASNEEWGCWLRGESSMDSSAEH